MNELLTYVPLFGSIIGFLLAIFVLVSKETHKGNTAARYYLAGAIIFTSANMFSLISIKYAAIEWILYVTYHFIGFTYLLYARKLLNLDINLRKWFIFLSGFTFIHALVIVLLYERWHMFDTEEIKEVEFADIVIVVDYYIAFLINVYAVYSVFKKVKGIPVNTSKGFDQMNLIWIKKVFAWVTTIYFALLFMLIVTTVLEILFNPAAMGVEMGKTTETFYNLIIKTIGHEKIELFLTSMFIFTIAIWSMRIPVFSNFQPVTQEKKEVKRYAKSTLKEDQSEEIWNQIKQLMEEKQLYRNPTLRLNDLVEEIGKPLPHISQVINERMNMSFLDFVNQYRVEEAKELLCDEKSQMLTILAIAYEVGFNSKTTFYTSFKKVTGQTPSEYKKSRQK